MDKYDVLKKYFGYEEFRYSQEAMIDTVAAGGDVLGVMPTGAGKSLCYQIPALLFSGMTLVISPLISLMKDQVGALVSAGIPAAYINTSLSPSQYQKVLERMAAGRYKLIYVAPERLAVPRFREICAELEISFVAVDEAHCVSQWGHDFRSAYLTIRDFIDDLSARPVVGAYTATATEKVRTDIEALLGLKEAKVFVSGFDRPNLFFDVRRPKGKFPELLSVLEDHAGQSGIVYCATRKTVEEVCFRLEQMGYGAARYHAGLSDRERKKNQDDFLYDRKTVMVATNAFGMGIDKSNVSFVAHYNMPKNLESYYQEAGRAGRDGEPADCVLLFDQKDIAINRYLIDHSGEESDIGPEQRREIRENELRQLRQMTAYCTSGRCLRGLILRYFGEESPGSCGHCGNCTAVFAETDRSVEAAAVFGCLAETRQRFGRKMVADILAGSRNKRVSELGLSCLSSYGALRKMKSAAIVELIDALTENGYLALTDEEYPILFLTEKGAAAARDGEEVILRQRAPRPAGKKAVKKAAPAADGGDSGLFELLREKRREIAGEEGVPAYIIFSDAALRDMSRKRPADAEAFLEISGVGRVKQERYGAVFLKVIADFAAEAGDSEKPAAEPPAPEAAPPPEANPSSGWTKRQDKALAAYVRSGTKLSLLAEHFGRTPDEVFDRLRELGIVKA